jgi:hypothetical protein
MATHSLTTALWLSSRRHGPLWRRSMSAEPYASIIERPRGAESVGRPLGSGKFLDAVEHKTRRVLKPAKRG